MKYVSFSRIEGFRTEDLMLIMPEIEDAKREVLVEFRYIRNSFLLLSVVACPL
jgi:hypothetical protein